MIRIIVVVLASMPACSSEFPEQMETNSTGSSTSEGQTSNPNQAGSESAGESNGETNGGDDPLPGCEQSVGGTIPRPFVLLLDDAPTSQEIDLQLTCEVLSIAVEGGMIKTTLDCTGGEGAPQLAGFEVPAPDEGAPAWEAAEMVTLSVRAVSGHGGLLDDPTPFNPDVLQVAMHRLADGMLLAAGTDAYGLASALYAPVKVGFDRNACGVDVPEEDWPGPDRNMTVSFEFNDETLVLLGGQSGVLDIGSQWLAIDVPSARAHECCHDPQWIVTVARLMTK